MSITDLPATLENQDVIILMPIMNVPAALIIRDVIILTIQMEDIGAGGAGNLELNLISIRPHAKLQNDI